MNNDVIIEAAKKYGAAVNLYDLRFKLEEIAHDNHQATMQATREAYDNTLLTQRVLLAAVQGEHGVSLEDIEDEARERF